MGMPEDEVEELCERYGVVKPVDEEPLTTMHPLFEDTAADSLVHRVPKGTSKDSEGCHCHQGSHTVSRAECEYRERVVRYSCLNDMLYLRAAKSAPARECGDDSVSVLRYVASGCRYILAYSALALIHHVHCKPDSWVSRLIGTSTTRQTERILDSYLVTAGQWLSSPFVDTINLMLATATCDGDASNLTLPWTCSQADDMITVLAALSREPVMKPVRFVEVVDGLREVLGGIHAEGSCECESVASRNISRAMSELPSPIAVLREGSDLSWCSDIEGVDSFDHSSSGEMSQISSSSDVYVSAYSKDSLSLLPTVGSGMALSRDAAGIGREGAIGEDLHGVVGDTVPVRQPVMLGDIQVVDEQYGHTSGSETVSPISTLEESGMPCPTPSGLLDTTIVRPSSDVGELSFYLLPKRDERTNEVRITMDWCRLYGFDEEDTEYLRHKVSVFPRNIHPEDRSKWERSLNDVGSGKSPTFIMIARRMMFPSREYHAYRVVASAVRWGVDGLPTLIAGYTARVSDHTSVRAAFESALDDTSFDAETFDAMTGG
ncbi:hypothetical protein KIPB_005694 [Kipferlia bialata]|uniref:PAS domain-containing protein n=1 Tax=Kipferlia bialata TaxID=797122 RepID=A0A9K3CW11_9EUKA|nr:hypothetical protein KIPB_005694 [Kipferlia bialata]|eukprot:g5694.t1